MNYLEHFGLQAEPFLNSSRVFYKSAVHGKALLQLMTAADAESGVMLLLGEPGVGKSLLLRRVLETISEESTRAALLPVLNGGLTERDLVRALGHQLRLGGDIESFATLNESLASLAEEDTKILILIDNAHRLSDEVLGALGELSSASIVLAGEKNPAYPAGTEFVVTALNVEATDAFIRLRLKVAGRVQEVFSAEARKLVYTITRGNPARINAVSEQALVACALAGMEKVDNASVLTTGLLLGMCDENANPVENHTATVAPVTKPKPSAPVAKTAAAKKAAPAPIEDLDDVLNQLADDDGDSLESATAAADDFDSMLGNLADDEKEIEASTASASDDGDDLDSMMSALSEDDDAMPTSASAKAGQDNSDLDSMLNDLAEDDADVAVPPKPAAKKSVSSNQAASNAADELDDMFDGMGGDEEVEEQPAPAAAKGKSSAAVLDDDLDSLLDGLDDEDDVVPVAKAKTPPAKTKPKAKPAPVEEDDFDNMLSGLDDELNAGKTSGGDATSEELDDLLGGLEDNDPPARQSPKGAGLSKAPDDDLDDLLAGLDDDEVPVPQPKAKVAVAKPKASVKPVPVPADDDELGDLLDSLNDESLDIEIKAPAKGKEKEKSRVPDNLENELDNLLEGLDD